MIDKQILYNRVIEGLASQGFEQSIDRQGETCQYRDGEGRKCAVGWLIPDEWYMPQFEKRLACAVEIYSLILPEGDRNLDNIAFLEELQTCHDMARHPLDMRINLRRLAKDYDLTAPAILESFR